MFNRRIYPFSFIILLLYVLCHCPSLVALPLMGSQTSGCAGSGVAANNTHGVYVTNPSTMMFGKYYSLESGYSSNGGTVQFSVVDTKTSVIGGGLSYFFQTNPKSSRHRQWKLSGFQLALGGRISEFLGIGVLGKYIWFDSLVDSRKFQEFDLDGGVHIKLGDYVAVGAVARNLLIKKTRETVPLPDLGVGLAIFPLEGMTIMVDGGTWWRTTALKKKWEISAGIDARVAKYLGVRAGYRYVLDLPEEQMVTAGLSLFVDSYELSYHGSFLVNSKPLKHFHGAALTMVF